jgi:PIN domain nuclease of toxin-antitoxin system
VILLDTSAVIWLERGDRRVRALARRTRRLYVSPATLFELQLLIETGRIGLRAASVATLAADDRWLIDDPPATAWFEAACDLTWTRDPFDRLLVAHAHIRGWQLATADRALAARLPASGCVVL